MIEDPSPSKNETDAGFVRWAPRALAGGANLVDDTQFKAALTAAIDELCVTELQIGAIRWSAVQGEEIQTVDCSISGFVGPLMCRMRKVEIDAFRDAALGAREGLFGGDAGLEGPIGRHVSDRLMRSLIVKFCAIASASCGETIEPFFEQDGPSNALRPHPGPLEESEVVIEISICDVRIEFVLSRTDYSLINRRAAADGPGGAAMRADIPGTFENTLGELAVCLSVVLDGRTVTAGELRSWRKGSVVQLLSRPQSHARLVANGRTFGRCEIVRDAELFAVRLVVGADVRDGSEDE